jgi:hypothetical protein
MVSFLLCVLIGGYMYHGLAVYGSVTPSRPLGATTCFVGGLNGVIGEDGSPFNATVMLH